MATAESAHIVGALTSGILAATSTAANLLDTFADQIASQTALHGLIPSAVVVHPTVLATLRKQRGSGDGQFYLDPLSSAPAAVHGVPLVPTASTAAATAWVVTGRAATVFRRGGVSVELGSNTDDWVRNQRTMRCEERLVCAVQQPSMISKITISG